MIVVGCAASKGGVGKSTLTTALGVAAAQDGLRTLLVDTDKQGSTRKWGSRREVEPQVMAWRLRDVPGWLEHCEQKGIDLVIIDFAGGDSVALFDIFKRLDLVIVPTAPTLIEMEEVVPVMSAAKAAKLDAVVVITRVPRANSLRVTRVMDENRDDDSVAPQALTSLVAYPDAFAQGLGVTETDPGSRAATELRTLLKYLIARAKR